LKSVFCGQFGYSETTLGFKISQLPQCQSDEKNVMRDGAEEQRLIGSGDARRDFRGKIEFPHFFVFYVVDTKIHGKQFISAAKLGIRSLFRKTN